MIVPALIAGLLCLALVISDARRRPGTPFALARAFVACSWAAGWLAYGINATGFAQPSAQALLILSVACIGSILMVPGPRVVPPPDAAGTAGGSWQSQIVFWSLLAIGLFVVTWDIAWLWKRFAAYGWAMGLKIHRLDRMTMTGGFWLPGLQVMRAAAVAFGAVGYAYWLRTRRPRYLLAATVGLAAAILSTGRWDVVNYGVWFFLIAAFDRHSTGYGWYGRQAVFVVAMAIFFVGHGELFGKNEHLTTLAEMPEQQRMEAAGAVTRSEPGAVAKPKIGGTKRTAPTGKPVSRTNPQPATGAAGSATTTDATSADASDFTSCTRWEVALTESNQRFRRLSSAAKALLLYVSGPFAALDRAICEGPGPVRQVITYWPLKVARILHLREPEEVLAVDEYVDIGLPFNNYSVIYPFVNEIGPTLGLFAWIGVALALRWIVKWLVARHHVALVAAAMAPISMAIRTPWTNTYFDGTLAIWMAVCVAVWWAERAGKKGEGFTLGAPARRCDTDSPSRSR